MTSEERERNRPPVEGLARRVLEGIADIGYTKTGETTFAGCVVACMDFLGTPVTYDHVMGVSGAAFKLLWSLKWCSSNNSMGILGEEPIRRTFRALGYGYELVVKTDKEGLEDKFRRRIIESINKRRPVIAWGIVGPPDEGIVTGYDKNGEVLVGRSYFYDGSKGYYEKADWFKDCWGLLLIGDKTRPPSKREILREALEWAVLLARTPTSDRLPGADGGRASGVAAYDAWAEALRRDEDFPPGDLKVLTFRCNVNASVTLSGAREARMTAAQFLKGNTEGVGDGARSDILGAASAYEQEESILRDALKRAPFCFAPEEERLKIANPKLRATLADLVLQAKEKDSEAVEHLEQALQKMRAE